MKLLNIAKSVINAVAVAAAETATTTAITRRELNNDQIDARIGEKLHGAVDKIHSTFIREFADVIIPKRTDVCSDCLPITYSINKKDDDFITIQIETPYGVTTKKHLFILDVSARALKVDKGAQWRTIGAEDTDLFLEYLAYTKYTNTISVTLNFNYN